MNTLPLIEHIESLFKQNDAFSDKEGKLFIPKILESIDKIDEELVKLLMQDEKAKEQFFMRVEDVYVLKQNDLIEFFTMNEYFNHSFTSYTNKIGLIRKDNFIKKFDDVVLAFPYKDCVLEGGQTKDDEKNNEVFYNSILSRDEIDRLFEPKVITNIKRFDKEGEHEVEEINEEDNLIIKGNNLLALHSLKKRYAGKVKLIYIDPPYNTGGDSFGYNDSFNHSTWLTFMKNRLEVARELLSNDGSIFIQIDYHEAAYLNILMNEIFGRENCIQTISVKTASPAGFKTVNPGPIDVSETILFYTKNRKEFPFKKQYVPIDYDDNYDKVIENFDENPENWSLKPLRDIIYEMNGIIVGKTPQQSAKNAKKIWGEHWKIIRLQAMAQYALDYAEKVISIRDPHKPTKKLKELLAKSKIERNQVFVYIKENNVNGYIMNGGAFSFYRNKIKNIDGVKTPTSLLTDFWADISWDGIAKEGGITLKNGKKPEKLLKRIIQLSTNKNDLVLDFHLGSGTTCAVAHKMGRRYIGIEQMDYIEDIAVERIKKVIDAEQGGISKAVEWQGGGSFVYAELKEIDTFSDSPINKLNKNMQYLPICEIEDEEYAVIPKEIELNKKFYGVEDA